MLNTPTALGGMVVAPHHLAAQAGRDVLRDGGNAVEAMVAAAAAIAVVYPHMNAIGGDGFWLIHEPGRAPVAIDACGAAVARADRAFYAGLDAIPSRGPRAALIASLRRSTIDGRAAASATWPPCPDTTAPAAASAAGAGAAAPRPPKRLPMSSADHEWKPRDCPAPSATWAAA